MRKIKVLFLAIPLLSCIFVHGQTASLQLLGSSGDTYKNSNYQIDWSVGELLTETYAGPENLLTQGFHQGNYTITAISEMGNLQLKITAFPNPATDFVILSIESQNLEGLGYLLTDVNGKILQDSQILTKQQQIDLEGIATGAYFLNVRSGKKALKTFKIIKSN